jgi:hypothetical protein
MAFTEDLSQFFDTDDFAVAAIIKTSAAAVVRNINVIFDKPSNPLALFEGQVTKPMPFVRCRTADVADVIANSHTMTIAGTEYRIVEPPEDDGTGVSTVQIRI